MSFRFLLPAIRELDTAVDYYGGLEESLSQRFLAEFERTLSRIESWPEAWMPVDQELRRYRIKGFPYGMISSLDGDVIIVVSIMNLHRHPDCWRDNLNPPA